MTNFKAKCRQSNFNFTKGKMYIVADGKLVDDSGCVRPINGSKCASLQELNDVFDEIFELVPGLPRICYILGGEDNPLKVGEEWAHKGFTGSVFRISPICSVMQFKGIKEPDKCWKNCDGEIICNIINHSEKIIRQLQFSEDEKALMRVYAKFGYTVLRKPEGYGLQIERPDARWFPLPDGMFAQITPENSSFNFAKYLEGLQ